MNHEVKVRAVDLHMEAVGDMKVTYTARGTAKFWNEYVNTVLEWEYVSLHDNLKISKATIWPHDPDPMLRRHMALIIKKKIVEYVNLSIAGVVRIAEYKGKVA